MSGLRIVIPVSVTESMLLASDVPENDYPAWASGTAYSQGQRVIDTHLVWESLQSGTGKKPDQSPQYWVCMGAVNRWKCLDASTTTQTVQAGGMSYTLRPGKVVSAVSLLNLSAQSARVRMVSPNDGVVYDRTQSLRGTIPTASWWDYFFAELDRPSDATFLDLPPYGSADIIVDLDAGVGEARLGVLHVGPIREVPVYVQFGAEISIADYSRKEADDFGEAQLMRRAWAKRGTFEAEIPTSSVDALTQLFASLRATPCLWIVYEPIKSTVIFGWYREFVQYIKYAKTSYCVLEIEGLI